MNKLKSMLAKESVIISLVAIILGILIGALVMLVGGYNPLLAYQSLVEKIFGSAYDMGRRCGQSCRLSSPDWP